MSWKIKAPILAFVWLGGAVGMHSEGGCKWWEALTMMGIVVAFAIVRTSAQQQSPEPK